MDRIHKIGDRESGMASGLKAAVLVVLIGIVAALADHSLLASHATSDAAHAPPAAYAEAPAQSPAVPAELRAHAGEVPPHVEAF